MRHVIERASRDLSAGDRIADDPGQVGRHRRVSPTTPYYRSRYLRANLLFPLVSPSLPLSLHQSQLPHSCPVVVSFPSSLMSWLHGLLLLPFLMSSVFLLQLIFDYVFCIVVPCSRLNWRSAPPHRRLRSRLRGVWWRLDPGTPAVAPSLLSSVFVFSLFLVTSSLLSSRALD